MITILPDNEQLKILTCLSNEKQSFYSFSMSNYEFSEHETRKESLEMASKDAAYKRIQKSNINSKETSLNNSILSSSRFFNEVTNAYSVVHLSSKRIDAQRLTLPHDELFKVFQLVYRKPLAKTAKAFIIKWLKRFKIGTDYEIEEIDGSAIKVTILTKKYSGVVIRESLADKGSGDAQIFRVLITLANAINEVVDDRFPGEWDGFTRDIDQMLGYKSKMILIEEPEANLHPAAQAMLADVLMEVTTKYSHFLQVVIETHSEYLIRRLQVITKNNNKFLGKAIINYIEGTANTRNCREITIDSKGKLSEPFGTGFYDAASNLTMDLF